MLILKIRGSVREAETDIGLPGLLVQVYDPELHYADLLGMTYTGAAGSFEIVSQPEDFREFFDVRPDLYLKVFAPGAADPLYTIDTPVRWNGWGLPEFDVRIPRDRLRDVAPERGIRLLADDGSTRDTFDVGEPLIVEIRGVRPATVHDIVLQSADGSELFTNRLLTDRYGVITPTVIWPQIGLDNPHSEERFSIEKGHARWGGQALALEVREGEQVLMKSMVRVSDGFTRPLVLSTDSDGVVLNGFEAGVHDAIVSGYNLPFHGRIRVYMVPRQHGWWASNQFAPVQLASGRPAYADVDVEEGERSFRARVAQASDLEPGAYDFVVRLLRYGYEDDEDFRLRATDLVAYRTITGLVVRQDFMESKTVLGGCVNALPISGRTIMGPPYFQYADTFQVGENIYGALDPAALDPGHLGKMVALYVIKHPIPQTVTLSGGLQITLPWDRKLYHLPVLGGNAAVQKLKTQVGCINFNTRLLWQNAILEGEYDIVADFGNNISDAALFATDAKFNPPLDIIDGYFLAGFRVVPDPTVYSEFDYAGSFNYIESFPGYRTFTADPGQDYGDESVVVGVKTIKIPRMTITVPMEGKVFFPADMPGATTPAQISTRKPAYPMVVIVHGQGHSYLGYNKLLEHFARNGFIAAAINCANDMHGIDRARLLFEHLPILKAKFGIRMLPFIGLMGHSRGGEAVVIAARLNEEEALGYYFGAIISLAPTSQYVYQSPSGVTFSPSLEGLWATPYLVLYGAMDEDVTGRLAGPTFPQKTGFALYDRAKDAQKSMVFVYGATHNGFIGGVPGFGSNLGHGSDEAQLLVDPVTKSPETQEMIAKGYIMAFFRQHLLGDSRWEGIFRGEWVPATIRQAQGGKARLYVQYAETPNEVVVVDDFEGTHTTISWQSSTISGTVADDGTLPIPTVTYPSPNPDERALFAVDDHSPHATSGLLLRWNNMGDLLRFKIPPVNKDVTKLSVVSFRVTQKAGSTLNPAGQDFYLMLTDTAGKSRSIRVSKFGEIPSPQERENPDFTKSAMRTIRIPLHVFKIEVLGTDRVDLANVASLTFLFSWYAAGEIEIDSVEFAH